jgi:hypothetical protein
LIEGAGHKASIPTTAPRGSATLSVFATFFAVQDSVAGSTEEMIDSAGELSAFWGEADALAQATRPRPMTRSPTSPLPAGAGEIV